MYGGNLNQAAMDDLRGLVAHSLGIKAVYASHEPRTVRCFVEVASAGSSGAHEWEICLLSPREQRVASSVPSVEIDRQAHGLEEALDCMLGISDHRGGAESRSRSEQIYPNGQDITDILYSNIPRYNHETPQADILQGLSKHSATANAPGLKILRGIVKAGDGKELAVFDYEQQALSDMLTFNRALLDDNEDACLTDVKRRFIVFQMVKLVRFLHQRGLSSKTTIIPRRTALTLGMYIRLGGVPTPLLQNQAMLPGSSSTIPRGIEQVTTVPPTERWCRGDLSNFEYLMLLNAAAGRRMIDGVFHPVMPWVTDFTAPFSGWRDLSRSKFRLNKGDNQLDRTYETSTVPHHITESLSEITYYIYMARQTPMTVLRQIVRSNFQPKEYPSSLERMFQWTPDECIPEFYTEPTAFASIHGQDVMPDLTLPAWCSDAHDFVNIHREMLESATVSAALHDWIDLNFGVCLSGDEAIRNKNVPLRMQASGSAATRKSPGFVQLFSQSHPHRHVPKSNDRLGDAGRSSASPVEVSSDNTVRRAARIIDSVYRGTRPVSPSTGARAVSKQRLETNSSPGSVEPKGLSSSFAKLKKKQKPPSNSQIPRDGGGLHTGSPTKDRDNSTGNSRSPKFSRLAHAIPKLFSTESLNQSPPSAANESLTTEPKTTVDNEAVQPDVQNSPTSQHHSVGANSSHIFRELWHQLSKNDDFEHSGDISSITSGSFQSVDPMDWTETDFETLDEMSLLLLRAGAPIVMPTDAVASSSHPPMLTSKAREEDITSIDPAYEIPATVPTISTDGMKRLTSLERVIAYDVFVLGCTIAELYLSAPLFSCASIAEYIESYHDQSSQHLWEEQLPLRERMRAIPIDTKEMILSLIHPSAHQRLSTWVSYTRFLDGPPKQKHSRSATALFPDEFPVLHAFLHEFHQHCGWNDRFRVVRSHLPSLCALPDNIFGLCVPVLTSFFKPRSHVTGINRTDVSAAVVLLLPPLADRLGPYKTKIELLDDTIHLYDRPDLSPIVRMCLSTPEHIKTVIKAFGSLALLRHVLPIIIDWLALPPVYQAQSMASPLFTNEATSMAAAALGEAASCDGVGPALTVKYLLPLLLSHLGKVSNKWTKLMDARTVVSCDAIKSDQIGGKNNDGIHVAFVPKQVLYEPHGVADAVLLVCRELPPSAVSDNLLPHLLTVLPRLVTIAETVSSARIEGVPNDLAQEIYVTLRVLRHVVRSLSEQAVERELIQQRASQLVSLLDSVHPPFLHPRTVDAVLTSVSESAAGSSSQARPSLTRHQTAPPTAGTSKNRRSRLLVEHLMSLRSDKAHDLRAFTAVGIARTVTSVLQKVGADVVSTSPSAMKILNAINAFLMRCAEIYKELEVTDFQWRMASEVVSEFCAPLRTLLGAAAFARHLPIVSASSVLQLLLLPATSSTDHTTTPTSPKSKAPLETNDVKELVEHHPELLFGAYRSARIYGLKTTSFLHLSLKSNHRVPSHDLNEEVFVAQEERKKRRLAISSSASTSNTDDLGWLRPRVKTSFRDHGEEDISTHPSLDDAPIGTSWSLRGHVHHSQRAHSSATRSIHVDSSEQLAITSSTNGSCRVWRLSSYPGPSIAIMNIDASSPVLSAHSLEDSRHAMALAVASVHVWDIRTSQAVFKAPFPDDRLHSTTLLRVPPYVNWSSTSTPDAASRQGSADIAVSSNRKLFLLDTRVPRVVADWRADAHDATWITTTALVCSISSPVGLIAVGTALGLVKLLDKRMGSVVTQWQAVDSRVVKIVQYSASHLLVVGSEREARVWVLNNSKGGIPALGMTILNVPENVRPQQITVQSYVDTAVLYVATAAKVYCCRLSINVSDAESTRRIESWSLLDYAGHPQGLASTTEQRPRLHRTKVAAQSVAVLPLRQVVLVGGEDGTLRSVV